MKARWLGMVLAAGLFTSAAMATNIDISVQQSNGTNAITVTPGATVNYKIIGTLTDAVNEGLALIGLSLDFDLASPGGDLAAASTPSGPISCSNPMPAFVIPDGITNPAGFGGTVIGGSLIQVGGGQNTIKNTVANAPFPIGTVITGVAKPGACGPATIATGSLTIPVGTANGVYHLNAFDVFANVIKAGETGAVFFATEAAGAGAVTNLAITVSGDVPKTLVSSIPPFTGVGNNVVPANGTLWRSLRHIMRFTFDSALPVTPPTPGQVQIVELLAGGAFGPDVSSGFAFTIDSANVLKVRETSTTTTALVHRHWYAVRNTGGWTGVANFEAQFPVQAGDASGDNRVLNADVLQINSGVACVTGCGDQNRLDIDGDGRVLNADVLQANTRVTSLPVPKPSGH